MLAVVVMTNGKAVKTLGYKVISRVGYIGRQLVMYRETEVGNEVMCKTKRCSGNVGSRHRAIHLRDGSHIQSNIDLQKNVMLSVSVFCPYKRDRLQVNAVGLVLTALLCRKQYGIFKASENGMIVNV